MEDTARVLESGSFSLTTLASAIVDRNTRQETSTRLNAGWQTRKTFHSPHLPFDEESSRFSWLPAVALHSATRQHRGKLVQISRPHYGR
jgi:hypothetical protein